MNQLKLWVIGAYLYLWQRGLQRQERRLHKEAEEIMLGANKSETDSEDAKRAAAIIVGLFLAFAVLSTKGLNKDEARVPKAGEYLLYLFLSRKERESLIGDLAEEYLEVLSKFGRRAANIWYYKQVGTSLGPLIIKTVRWGAIAWLGHWVRRFI